MAAESVGFGNMWQDVLPSVYELILCNTDKIVDDTSLEKLLGLMEHMNKNPEQRKILFNKATFQFLNDVQHSCNPTAVGFGLRLTATIGSKPDGFRTLSDPGGGCCVLSSNSLFCKVVQEENGLWVDPVVKDSYFKGAMALLDASQGLSWAQNSGCLQQAMNSLVDSSIFVADNARKLISKYLIALFIFNQRTTDQKKTSHLEDLRKEHCHRTKDMVGCLREDDLTCVQCIVYQLKDLIQMSPSGLERKAPLQVSVTQLLLSLFEENASVAQEIFHDSGIFNSCLDLLRYTNKDECAKVVDVVSTFMNNTSKWNINWDLLLNSDGQDTLYSLLEFAFILSRRSLVFLTFQFAQGLFAIPCPCELQDLWLCSLFALFTFPVHGSLHEVTTNKVNHLSLKETAKHLVSAVVSKESAYQVVDSIFGESGKKFLESASVTHSLLVTTDIIKDFQVSKHTRLHNFIKSWIIDVVVLLTQQSECPQTGNRMLRQCIKTLTMCIHQGFLHNVDGRVCPSINKTFSLLLKLSNERLDSQILTGCLEAFKTLLLCVDQSSLARFFQQSEDKVTLSDVLHCYCSHSCWDVKDSVLGFFSHILVTFTGEKQKLFQSFLIEHHLLNIVWTWTCDIESYVRASAIQLVGVISGIDALWKAFCEEIQLLPETIIRHLLEAFRNDEAAFSRRAIITLLASWVKNKHELTTFILRQQPYVGPSLQLDPIVANVLEKAGQDFDWEVKICVLNFWEDTMKWCTTREETGIDNEGEKAVALSNTMNTLSCVGFDKAVLWALVDCDKPVRRRGLELLQSWREMVVVETHELATNGCTANGMIHLIESTGELEEYLSNIDNEKDCTLAKILPVIDLSQLSTDNDSDSMFSDPLPFLKDILLAATDSEDNLLDCY